MGTGRSQSSIMLRNFGNPVCDVHNEPRDWMIAEMTVCSTRWSRWISCLDGVPESFAAFYGRFRLGFEHHFTAHFIYITARPSLPFPRMGFWGALLVSRPGWAFSSCVRIICSHTDWIEPAGADQYPAREKDREQLSTIKLEKNETKPCVFSPLGHHTFVSCSRYPALIAER